MQPSPAIHRTIVAVEMAKFTDPPRTTSHRVAVHRGLYEVLTSSFAEAGIDLDVCTVVDRGDGAIILIPSDIPKALVVDQLPARLTASLRRYNASHSVATGLRLSVALHAGEVRQTEHGVISSSVNLAVRLAASPLVKEALVNSTSPLAVIVSDDFHGDVIIPDPATGSHRYRRVSVDFKGTSAIAWLQRPSGDPPPTTVSADDLSIPVTAYISNGTIHHQVESAIRKLLASSGLVAGTSEEAARGGRSRG